MKILFNNFSFFLVIVLSAGMFVYFKNDAENKMLAADYEYSLLESKFVNEYYDNYEKNLALLNRQSQANTLTPPKLSTDPNNVSTHPLDTLQVPVFTNGVDAYMFAENVLNIASGIHIKGSGVAYATMNIEQQIRSEIMRDNDGNYYYMNAAHSFLVKTGFEAYNNGRQFKTRKTKDVNKNLVMNTNGIAWSNTTELSFKNNFGNLPYYLNYIVTKDTVKEVKNFKFENDKYTFTLVLDENKSTENYKKQIRYISDSDGYPQFSSVELEVTMSKDARFEKIVATDKYRVTAYGYNSPIHSIITYTFETIHNTVVIEKPSNF